jgi:CRISPR-associated protein Csb1
MAYTLSLLKTAVRGDAAAVRCRTDYQPAGGPGDKIFPATYEKGEYATETRWLDGAEVHCVLIDSVQSQANRMEEALLDAYDRGEISLPVVSVDFRSPDLLKSFRVTSLDAPHRLADALLRDSQVGGKKFRDSAIGKPLTQAGPKNATYLFGLCPTALVFGMWDSTGPAGGGGAKFQRAVVSEIVGLHAIQGKRTSSRLDPAQIMVHAGPLYVAKDGGWTLDESEALRDKKSPVKLGKDGKPSEANHGNITPTIADGGFTISKAVQTTVVSLAALRRLRFPADGESRSRPEVDDAARTALAALALYGAVCARERGGDLRSRCHIIPTAQFIWEIVNRPGTSPVVVDVPVAAAREVLSEAVREARDAGLPWQEKEVRLQPSADLLRLVAISQKLAAKESPAAEA